jgi:hypothetical protein
MIEITSLGGFTYHLELKQNEISGVWSVQEARTSVAGATYLGYGQTKAEACVNALNKIE